MMLFHEYVENLDGKRTMVDYMKILILNMSSRNRLVCCCYFGNFFPLGIDTALVHCNSVPDPMSGPMQGNIYHWASRCDNASPSRRPPFLGICLVYDIVNNSGYCYSVLDITSYVTS